MSVSSISDFLLHMASVDRAAFGHPLSTTEWRILLTLGKGMRRDQKMPASGQSYKALRCASALSDDALSRGLRHLMEMGLIERSGSTEDQRVMQYRLSPEGHNGLLRIGWEILQQAGALFIALSLPIQAGEMGAAE